MTIHLLKTTAGADVKYDYQVKVSDHSKTYAQVAALQPPPKKTHLINETFTKNTSSSKLMI